MGLFSNNDSQTRRKICTSLVIGVATLALAACGNSGSDSAASGGAAGGAGSYELPGDHAIGNVDAPVTVTEYASVVCGACFNWHSTVYPDFKAKYIDSGKVRFVFREFPTSPERLAQVGFLIANCAPTDQFFNNISLQFKRQSAIFDAARNGNVRDEYVSIAKAAGLSEDEFEACITSEENIDAYQGKVKAGVEAGVTSTPTFFVNGKKIARVPSGGQLFTLESFDEVLGPLLGEEVSESEPEGDSPAGE